MLKFLAQNVSICQKLNDHALFYFELVRARIFVPRTCLRTFLRQTCLGKYFLLYWPHLSINLLRSIAKTYIGVAYMYICYYIYIQRIYIQRIYISWWHTCLGMFGHVPPPRSCSVTYSPQPHLTCNSNSV